MCGSLAGILFLRHFRTIPVLGRMIFSMMVCIRWFFYWFCISLVSFVAKIREIYLNYTNVCVPRSGLKILNGKPTQSIFVILPYGVLQQNISKPNSLIKPLDAKYKLEVWFEIQIRRNFRFKLGISG